MSAAPATAGWAASKQEERPCRSAISTHRRAAHRYALWALGSSAVGILLVVLALLTR